MQTFKRYWPAWIVLVFIALILVTAGWGLLNSGGIDPAVLRSRRLWRVVRFSFLQAGLSTLFSLCLGLMLALALHRRRFWGRGGLIALLSAGFVMPPIVVAAGVIGVFGRSGWLSAFSGAVFGAEFGQWLFGLPGIVIAHVFFNAAFSARVFLGQLETVPAARWRLAQQMGFGAFATLRLIDLPSLKPALPNLSVLIFLLTFTSFAIVLTLGGGPRATTLEVAVYEALKHGFDTGKAVTLALVQALIGLSVLAAAHATRFPWPDGTETRHPLQRGDEHLTGPKLLDALTAVLVTLFLLMPAAALFTKGAVQFVQGHGLNAALGRALLTSLIIAHASAIIALMLSVCMGLAGREIHARHRRTGSRRARLLDLILGNAANLILVLPVFVLSTGLFVVLRHTAAPHVLALPLIIIVNALMALPFAAAQMSPALTAAANQTDRTCLALGLSGWRRFRRVDLPLVRPALARASAYALALSLGDLGVVALFGSQKLTTLPFLLYQRMGTYRFGEAMATALVLVTLVVFLFITVEKLGKRKRTVLKC